MAIVLQQRTYHPVSTSENRKIGVDGGVRPTRLLLSPVLCVDLVHGRKVLHVRQEYIDFHDIVDGSASCLEYGGQVLDALVLQ